MSVHRFDARSTRPVADRRPRARLRAFGLWFVTGFDDFVIERFWGRLRRGDVRGAFRVWTELLFGFWGCALVPLALALAIGLIVATWHAPGVHGHGRTPRPASTLQEARVDR